jgi:hypothetical protein
MAAVGFIFGFLLPPVSVKRRIWGLVSIIIFGFVLSIIIQSIAFSAQLIK